MAVFEAWVQGAPAALFQIKHLQTNPNTVTLQTAHLKIVKFSGWLNQEKVLEYEQMENGEGEVCLS